MKIIWREHRSVISRTIVETAIFLEGISNQDSQFSQFILLLYKETLFMRTCILFYQIILDKCDIIIWLKYLKKKMIQAFLT